MIGKSHLRQYHRHAHRGRTRLTPAFDATLGRHRRAHVVPRLRAIRLRARRSHQERASVRCSSSTFGQCRVRPFPGPLALASTASTDSVKVRCSFGFIAPTPMSLRAISSPRSLRIETTTVYSQGSPSAGCRMLPSMRSGVSAGVWASRRRHRSAGDAGRPDRPLRSRGWSPCSADSAGRPGVARAHAAHEPAPLSASLPLPRLPAFAALPSSQPNSA